jgi:hypothetical protein
MSIAGWPGVVAGIGVFALTWVILEIMTPRIGGFTFEPFEGFFDKILPIYLDIAKFIIGLGAGGIVLIIGSSALGSAKRLPQSYASPLFLLAVSVLFGIIFMPLLVLNYEAFKHKTSNYERWQYIRNRALGYSSLACFCIGYGWLIWAATMA